MAKIIYASALLLVLFLSLPSALNAENSPVASPAGSQYISEGKAIEVAVESSWFNWFLQVAGFGSPLTDIVAAAPEAQAGAAPALAPAPSAQGKSLRSPFLW